MEQKPSYVVAVLIDLSQKETKRHRFSWALMRR